MESDRAGTPVGDGGKVYKLQVKEESSMRLLLRSERQMEKLPQLNSQLTTSNKLNSS